MPKIHQLVAQYPGRINFELSVITLSDYRQRLMPHAPSVKHLMKVLDGPAVSSANFYAFDAHTMSKDAAAISSDQSEVRALDGDAHAGAGAQRGDGRADAAGSEASAGGSAAGL